MDERERGFPRGENHIMDLEIITSSAAPIEHQDPVPVRPSGAKKRGGWRAIKYILGNESFEKLASMSLIANLTLYLRNEYNLDGVFVVNVQYIWMGSSNISSLVGAVLADAYIGRFLTLFFGTIASLLGMITLTLTAAIPKLKPPACSLGDPSISSCEEPRKWQLGVLFAGLTLLALGAGGVRPCNIAFGADQFDTTTEKGKAQFESFVNWWYFSFTIALLIALTAVVYIQTEISWTLGFAIPAACFAFSITLFLIGRHAYIIKKPNGSIFVDIFRVVKACIGKRKVNLREGSHSFYNPPSGELQNPQFDLNDRFKCLSKAAVILDPSELDSDGNPRNTWTLCSLQQVEMLKCLVGIAPVWCSGIGCFITMDQQNTFTVLQAIQTDRSFGQHFKIPPAWMAITSMIALSVCILVYQSIHLPWSRKITKWNTKLEIKERIRIGIVMSILCMVVAGIVERRRRDLALKHGSLESPLSIGYLVPQNVLSGLTEAFASVAIMEFYTVRLPESMRSVAGAVFFLSSSIASYLSTLIVNIIHIATRKGGKSPWLGGHDLNKNRLDYYYFIIASLNVVNFVYYQFFASKYVYKPSSRVGESPTSRNDDMELETRTA